ncbi:hypothetical protein NJ7G_2027 [Natrinema sp. J7-2]|nr:hypothetical protein NJ7G_2027 [Natrinema sp. J7-2]
MLKKKLVGNQEERAVSPVIGVILMVAITVILAAVIAAFVLDLGGSVGQEAQAGVTIEVDEQADQIQVEVTSIGNSDYVNISGAVRNEDADGTNPFYVDPANPSTNYGWESDSVDDELSNLQVGDVVTISDSSTADVRMGNNAPKSGTVTAVAVIEEDSTETQVASEDFEVSWSSP